MNGFLTPNGVIRDKTVDIECNDDEDIFSTIDKKIKLSKIRNLVKLVSTQATITETTTRNFKINLKKNAKY